MSKQEESEKLSRGQQSLVGPWAIRSQGWLLIFELWPIYWLILQGRLSQENNQDQFICVKITCNKTKMTDLKWLLNKFCKGPLVVCLTIRLLGASLCSLIACWLSTLCCYSRRMQNFYYYYYYWTAVLMHIYYDNIFFHERKIKLDYWDWYMRPILEIYYSNVNKGLTGKGRHLQKRQ